MHLSQGSQQEVQPQNPEQYQISTFTETDLPMALPRPTRPRLSSFRSAR